jgi:hypothetical protein
VDLAKAYRPTKSALGRENAPERKWDVLTRSTGFSTRADHSVIGFGFEVEQEMQIFAGLAYEVALGVVPKDPLARRSLDVCSSVQEACAIDGTEEAFQKPVQLLCRRVVPLRGLGIRFQPGSGYLLSRKETFDLVKVASDNEVCEGDQVEQFGETTQISFSLFLSAVVLDHSCSGRLLALVEEDVLIMKLWPERHNFAKSHSDAGVGNHTAPLTQLISLALKSCLKKLS